MKFTREAARRRVLNCAKLYKSKLLNKKMLIIYRERRADGCNKDYKDYRGLQQSQTIPAWVRFEFREGVRELLLVMLYQAVIIVVEYLEYSVIGYFWGISEDEMDIAVSGALILNNVFVFCLVLALKRFFPGYKSAGKRNMLTDGEWAVFSVFPLFTIVVALVMYINFGVVQASGGSVMLCIACGMGAMNIVMFYLMNGIIKREQQIAENRLFRQKMENQTKEYYSMLENYERQRKRVHEFKNHIAVILALAKQGDYVCNKDK